MTGTRLCLAMTVAAAVATAAWLEVYPLPYAPSGQPVHAGGCLCTARIGDTTYVYAAKGNSTTDFYRYTPLTDEWIDLSPIPLGIEAKPVDDGACMCFDGERYIYLVKGNYSTGFYLYDINADQWSQLSDVPLGIHGQPVKGGTDVCFVLRDDTGYVYLLKGYDNEFYRYVTVSGSWQSLVDAPVGASPFWREGSWLAFGGGRRIYVHKAYYHELYCYDVDAMTWSTPLPGMPLIGSSGRAVRCDDGSSAAFWNGSIYALKGNGTSEFWRYDTATVVWRELDSVPPIGSTGRIRRPNYGADITLADSALYALKGYSTNELWRWTPTPTAVAGFAPMVYTALKPVSEPLRGRARVRCWVPADLPARWRLTDAAGRIVRLAESRLDYGAILDLGPCEPGVYFLTVRSGPLALSTRLTVAR